MIISDSSTVSILRTIVADNSAGANAGWFEILGAATPMIDDSDVVNRNETFVLSQLC